VFLNAVINRLYLNLDKTEKWENWTHKWQGWKNHPHRNTLFPDFFKSSKSFQDYLILWVHDWNSYFLRATFKAFINKILKSLYVGDKILGFLINIHNFLNLEIIFINTLEWAVKFQKFQSWALLFTLKGPNQKKKSKGLLASVTFHQNAHARGLLCKGLLRLPGTGPPIKGLELS
jgi:hypothetical protein